MNKIVYEVHYRAGRVLFEFEADAILFKRAIMLTLGDRPGHRYNPPAGDPDHVFIAPRMMLQGCPDTDVAVAS